jgi:ribose transport system substrate-binding protein
MRVWDFRRTCVCVLLASVLLVAAGCNSSGSEASKGSASTSHTAEAIARTKQFTDQPSPFTETTPLPKALPPGTVFGWIQCVSATCATLTPILQAATSAIGGNLKVVKAGASAQEVQNAFTSLIQQNPAAIFIAGIVPAQVAQQIQQAKQAGILVVSTAVIQSASSGISANIFGDEQAALSGKLLADWVATKSTNSNVVFYTTAELSFLNIEQASFRSELAKVCAGCKQRTVNVPIATYGNRAPQIVVSDLQAHPSTTLMVFGAGSAATGMPAALKTANIKTPYIAASLTPVNLQDIQQGKMEAGLAFDYPVGTWMMVDAAARLILKAPLTSGEQHQMEPMQWLRDTSLKGADVSHGWTAYPDYASRFEQLWSVQ